MSEARDAIFERLSNARVPAAPAIQRVVPPTMPAEPEASLRARVEQAGGRFQSVRRENWTRDIEWPCALESQEHVYASPGAGASSPLESVPGSGSGYGSEEQLVSRGAGATAARVHDLAPLELCVLKGEFAVVENGAVWQRPTSALERAAALLASHLVILVDANALVPSLHQAYQRIDLRAPDFGWFLCGPSKTADIEQALVLGAHGPRTMSLVLLEE